MASTSSSAQDENESLTGHPYFSWILTPTNVSGRFHMGVPRKFVELLPSVEVSMVLHCRGKVWEMKYHGNRRHNVFGYNWRHFVVDNSLRVGDALIFELIGNKKVEFKVQVLSGKIPPIALSCNEGGSSATPILIE